MRWIDPGPLSLHARLPAHRSALSIMMISTTAPASCETLEIYGTTAVYKSTNSTPKSLLHTLTFVRRTKTKNHKPTITCTVWAVGGLDTCYSLMMVRFGSWVWSWFLTCWMPLAGMATFAGSSDALHHCDNTHFDHLKKPKRYNPRL